MKPPNWLRHLGRWLFRPYDFWPEDDHQCSVVFTDKSTGLTWGYRCQDDHEINLIIHATLHPYDQDAPLPPPDFIATRTDRS